MASSWRIQRASDPHSLYDFLMLALSAPLFPGKYPSLPRTSLYHRCPILLIISLDLLRTLKSTVSFDPEAKTAQMWVYQAATQQAKDALSFFSESPSWWYHHILLASWMAPAHQGCSLGKPSARTPASLSWAIIASLSSTYPWFRSCFSVCATLHLSMLKQLTSYFSICE